VVAAEAPVVVITATVGSGKARVVVGVEVKVAVLAGVVAHLAMDQVLLTISSQIIIWTYELFYYYFFSGGNSWGGDYDNGYQTGYGGGASAGPMRNSYVSERSAPYSRDYGGMNFQQFLM